MNPATFLDLNRKFYGRSENLLNSFVGRLVANKRPCDALGKALSCWRHGQRTRFLPAVPKRGKTRCFRQRNHNHGALSTRSSARHQR
jgi:hypothetical protein